MSQFSFHFETTGLRGVYSNNIVRDVTYQRNGSSGEGFHVIRFLHVPAEREGDIDEYVELLGVIFEDKKVCAVVNPRDLFSHWRGDSFEDGLREVITAWGEANHA